MRILIADDERKFTELLAIMVCNAGHEVAEVVTSGGLGAMKAYTECAPDVVLMDYLMPNFNGVTATRQILSKDPGARVVLITGMPDTRELQWAASDAGAMGVLAKPFSQAQLEDLLAILPYASLPVCGSVPEACLPASVRLPAGEGSVHSRS
jgi:CheY-like chemotaxis protein